MCWQLLSKGTSLETILEEGNTYGRPLFQFCAIAFILWMQFIIKFRRVLWALITITKIVIKLLKGQSTTNILKLLFFTINLQFVKSNQISTSRKLNLPLTSSIYFVFLPVKMTQTNQSIPLVFLLCLKRNDAQTFKSGTCKNPSPQCVCYWYNLYRWMFFILCVNWKALLFVKVYCYSETFEAPCCFLWSHCFERSPCCFLWSHCFERSPYFMYYSTVTIWC